MRNVSQWFRYSRLLVEYFKFRCVPIVMENDSVMCDSAKRKNEDLVSDDSAVVSKKVKTEDLKSEDNRAPPSINRIRKPKKVVLLLCYLGKNYYGMQRNHGVHTVESDLLSALVKADIILPEERDTPQLMKFQRAARTDKGVSAARQIVSLKIPIKDICNSLPAKVNKYLPPDIKVLCVKRVTQAFDAKIACDARTYSYVLPTFTFSDGEIVDEQYRISDERLEEVNNFLKIYLGTHNFYNFTSGRLPGDASCKRYIISIECEKPFVKDSIEFVIIKIKGQSFMLHQIRKMIGLAIAVIRKLVPAHDMFAKIWKNDRLDIPKAPSLGLLLEEVHYDWYNKKYGKDGLHEPLQWEEFQDVIKKFREEQILANIVSSERNEKSMLQWLQTLPYHTYDIREPKAPEPLTINTSEADKPVLLTNEEVVVCTQ